MRRRLIVAVTLFACLAVSAGELPPPLRNIIPTPQEIEPTGETFVLVADGAPAATLVIPPDAPAQVALAASHLARRVQEGCGLALPVVTADAFAGGPDLAPKNRAGWSERILQFRNGKEVLS